MKSYRRKLLLAGMLLGATAMLSGGTALAVQVGDKAPAFALAATTAKQISSAEFAGKKNLVLFFYIGAFTNT